jgi:hypothetical protein
MRRTFVIDLDHRDQVLRAYALFSDRDGGTLPQSYDLELDEDLRRSPSAAVATLIVWAWPDTGSGTSF